MNRVVSGFFNRTTCCLLGVLLCTGIPASADDDYLRVLEAEAVDTGGHTSPDDASSVARSARKVRSVTDNQTIRSSMGFGEFESELQANYSGTWLLYNKLTHAQRKTVYSTYQEDNRTSKVREVIVRLLSPG